MGSMKHDRDHAEGMVLSSHKEELLLACVLNGVPPSAAGKSRHLLRSGRVFVSFSFSKADPLFDPVTVAAHITVMLPDLMCKCSLRVKMPSLW